MLRENANAIMKRKREREKETERRERKKNDFFPHFEENYDRIIRYFDIKLLRTAHARFDVLYPREILIT